MDKAAIQNQRIEWVDIGKFICIMFVMLSHLSSGSSVLDQFYTPFFLTVFFFLSGYVYTQPGTFAGHLKKKTRTLFVPWLIFSNLNIALSMVLSLKGSRDFSSEFLWNLLQIRGHGDGIWFVAALFVAFIPFYFIIKWDKPKKACGLAFGLSLVSVLYSQFMPEQLLPWNSAALPWHLEYVFQAMFWMVLGYYFRQYGEKVFDKRNTTKNRVAIWAVYLATAYFPDAIGGKGVWIPLSYVRSLTGIIAVVALCKIVKSNRYIRFVGANTLIYFALHGKVYAVIEMLLEKAAGGFYAACLNNPWSSTLLAIMVTLVMSVVLIIPAMIINRYFPWMVGRKKRT